MHWLKLSMALSTKQLIIMFNTSVMLMASFWTFSNWWWICSIINFVWMNQEFVAYLSLLQTSQGGFEWTLAQGKCSLLFTWHQNVFMLCVCLFVCLFVFLIVCLYVDAKYIYTKMENGNFCEVFISAVLKNIWEKQICLWF